MRSLRWLGLVFCACGATLPNPWEVKDLRVIGMTLDQPEVLPGQRVHVTVFVDDPDGGGRPVQMEYGYCSNRGDNAGTFDCIGGPYYMRLGSGTAVPSGVGEISRFEFDYDVPAGLLTGKSQIAAQYGYSEHILVRATNGVRSQDATKRVVVRVPIDPLQLPNQNPVLLDFEVVRDGVVIDPEREGLVRGFEYLLRPLYDASSLETYQVRDFDRNLVTLDEEPSFVWSCATACSVDRRVTYRNDSLALTVPQQASNRDLLSVHVVLRDGRGGEAVLFKNFVLLPTVSAKAE